MMTYSMNSNLVTLDISLVNDGDATVCWALVQVTSPSLVLVCVSICSSVLSRVNRLRTTEAAFVFCHINKNDECILQALAFSFSFQDADSAYRRLTVKTYMSGFHIILVIT